MYFLFCFTVKHFYKQQYCKGKCKSICTLNRTAQQPHTGGRAAVFNQQEQEICNMVIVDNSIRLRQIQSSKFCQHFHHRQSFEKTSNDYETTLQGAI